MKVQKWLRSRISFVTLEHYDACVKKDLSEKAKCAMLKSMFSFLHQDISGRNVDGTGTSEVSEVVLVDSDPTQDYDPDLYKCDCH